MNLEEFEKNAKDVINWICNYFGQIRDFPVLSQVRPREVFNSLPSLPPNESESFEAIFRDFERIIMPGITHWQHPRFFAYFPANSSFPSVLAEFVSAAIAPQCMMWLTSPSATELEEKVVLWLRDSLGLSNEFIGVIQDTASTSTLVAILSAREKYSNYKINDDGFAGERFTVYCSTESHFSIEKDVKIAGIGKSNLRKIPVDRNFSMRADILEATIRQDIANGYKPLCIVGAFGTTSSLSVDPLAGIGEIAQRYNVWYHIDGAMAGSALILPEYQHYAEAINKADSFVFNPHKWLYTNFDCSVYFFKDKENLINTFSMNPEYLKTTEGSEVNNYKDWGIQLGRRFRALKLWFVIRSFGINGLRRKLASNIAWAKQLAKIIEDDKDFELLLPANFNLICFRFNPRGLSEDELDNINEQILRVVNSSGFAFLSHTRLNGHFAIRFCIGQTNTTWDDVVETYEFIRKISHDIYENTKK